MEKQRFARETSLGCPADQRSRGLVCSGLARPERSTDAAAAMKSWAPSFIGSDRTYGARRFWRDLLAEGISCGLHRNERLMQALKARPRQRRLQPIWVSRRSPPSCARPHLPGARSQSQMDCGLHLCVDRGRPALHRRGGRSILPARGRLVDDRGDDGPARHRWRYGGAANPMRCCITSIAAADPQRAVSTVAKRSRCHLLDDAIPQRLGQCSNRELLLLAQKASACAQNTIERGRKPKLTCSTTSSASTMLNARTRHSAT